MKQSETIQVLLSGAKPEFPTEWQDWIKVQKLDEVVTESSAEQSDNWVICRMPHAVAAELYRRLAQGAGRPFFVDAIFPLSVAASPQATVIKGPARDAQVTLVANLPPMTATPDALLSVNDRLASDPKTKPRRR